jgi:ribosomal protein S18 acetylase RimI-like enzyme
MELKSLGYKTDLFFTKLDGQVIDRGSYLVVKTLSNPNYFWGNLLIFDRAPGPEDFERWTALFNTEFLDPSIYHMTLAWDSEETGFIDQFLDAGFKLDKGIVLTAKQEDMGLPQKHLLDLEVSPAVEPEDWEETIRVQIECANKSLSKAEWESFYRAQMSRYRQLVAMGKGQWFCARLNGRVVGGLGLFTENRIGRFQIVSTHPQYQRRGICGTLVYKAAESAFKHMDVDTLVMVADEEYHAAKVYESVGFKPTEKLLGLCRVAKIER